ncbi:MAG: hypothetical protein EP298_09175 [Gammaproteobacteria bacterium]|nr:MAG: hypothetical protein EP298_09175 [Gammaproteobacteria bacterium]UTW42347.1 protein kinase [bacterium SCSIO 12844]
MPNNLPKAQVKTKINWESDERKQQEWQAAIDYFDHNPDALKKKHQRGPNNKQSHQSHSFIQVDIGACDKKILAINTKQLGLGACGKATLAEDQEGRLYAIKVADLSQQTLAGRLVSENEVQVAQDQQVAIGAIDKRISDKGHEKQYIVYHYLGESLPSYLIRNQGQLSISQQFDLAIQLFQLLDDMHSGRSSKRNQPMVHLDIKSDNLVIDKNGKLHLIDFGFSKKLDNQKIIKKMAPLYVPSRSKLETKEGLDLFAAIRVLGFLSDFCIIHNNRSYARDDLINEGIRWIFNNQLIDHNKHLAKLIDYAMGSQLTLPEDFSAKHILTILKVIAGVSLANEVTGDANKKKYILHDVNILDTKAYFLQSVRILTHHTNWFQNRFVSDPQQTKAYQVAKDYFDSAKELLDITQEEWDAVLTGNQEKMKNQGLTTKTYDNFLFKSYDANKFVSNSSQQNQFQIDYDCSSSNESYIEF